MSATAAPPTDGTACPRCGAHVAADQDWCLSCGDAARTRLVPTPNWRLPIAVAAVVCALALLAIAISFLQLTRDDAPVTPTATTTAPPAATTTAPPAATTTAPPAATTTAPPAATTTAPATTTATTPPSTTTTP